jgi:DNA polymerase-3 subunit epsilon
MDFITISFDTATAYRYTACWLELTFVKDNKIIDSNQWLIKPPNNEYDPFNTMVHGIKASDTINEPTFLEIWDEIRPLIEGKLIIAHHASFYLSVLRHTLQHYNIPFPTLMYGCTYIAAKKVYKGLPAYDLYTLEEELNIERVPQQKNYNSISMAQLAIHLFNEFEINSLDDFLPKLEINLGKIFEGGYEGCLGKYKRKNTNFNLITGDESKHNPNSIFYGASVCITGKLLSMERAKAFQKIADIGGIISPGVNKEIDYLIVGMQEYRYVGEEGMSTKQKKVLDLIKQGLDIEIMSEKEFLKNL